MNVNTLVIDDDPIFCALATEFVKRTEQLTLVGSYQNPFQAQELLREGVAGLVITDIEMPSLTGFELLKSLENPPLFIFMTSHREFAADSYDLDAVDYLVKPYTYERFMKAVNKALELFNARESIERQSQANQSDNYKPGLDHFFIRTDSQFVRLNYEDVIYFEAMKDFVKIHSIKGTFIAYVTLKIIEDQLPSPAFLRTHRSYIVNTSRIESLSPFEIKVAEFYVPLGQAYKDKIFEMLVEGKLIKR